MTTSPRARFKRANERHRDALEARNVAIVEGRSAGMRCASRPKSPISASRACAAS
jgi:hypothetical protein